MHEVFVKVTGRAADRDAADAVIAAVLDVAWRRSTQLQVEGSDWESEVSWPVIDEGGARWLLSLERDE